MASFVFRGVQIREAADDWPRSAPIDYVRPSPGCRGAEERIARERQRERVKSASGVWNGVHDVCLYHLIIPLCVNSFWRARVHIFSSFLLLRARALISSRSRGRCSQKHVKQSAEPTFPPYASNVRRSTFALQKRNFSLKRDRGRFPVVVFRKIRRDNPTENLRERNDYRRDYSPLLRLVIFVKVTILVTDIGTSYSSCFILIHDE